jgi:hypothetical protein
MTSQAHPKHTTAAVHHKQTFYLIRHGEKPPKNPDGSDQDGLSAQGLTRAQGLVQVFGPDSGYDIKYILAEKPKKGKSTTYTALPKALTAQTKLTNILVE